MGGAPSRETLLRSIMVEPTAAPQVASKPRLVLVPLISDYFPSPNCPIFQKFLELRRDPNVLYYYRDASLTSVSERVVPAGAGTDKDLYSYYMSLGEQRLVETDEDLVELHRAGRIFSPVPCVIAFTSTSSHDKQGASCDSNFSATTAGLATSEKKNYSSSETKPDEDPNMLKSTTTTSLSPVSQANTRNTTLLHEVESDPCVMANDNVYLPRFNIHVRITGFIGDTQICSPSMSFSNSIRSPMEMGLFLSKSLGGNYRINVTLLAAYTYISQLKQIGILSSSDLSISDQLTCCSKLRGDEVCKAFLDVSSKRCQNNDMLTQQRPLQVDFLDNLSYKPTSGGAYNTESYCSSSDVLGTTVADLTSPFSTFSIFARPIRFCFHRTDVPSMCFLRELRMRIATWQLRQCDGKRMSGDKCLASVVMPGPCGTVRNAPGAKMCSFPLPLSIISPEVIHSTINDSLLVVMVNAKDTWRIFLWAVTYIGKSLSFLTNKNTFKMRKELSKLNLTTNTVDYLYTSTQMPNINSYQLPGLESGPKELVWIPPHDTYRVDSEGSPILVPAGTVLRLAKCIWEVSNNEFAEDLLLTICRRTNMSLRDAKPEDPHWVRNHGDSSDELPVGLAQGFLIWREECAGQVVYHGTKPIFLKKWLESGCDPVAEYIAYISALTSERNDNLHVKPSCASTKTISVSNSFCTDLTDKSSQQGFSCDSLLLGSRSSLSHSLNYTNKATHQEPMTWLPHASTSLNPKTPLLETEAHTHRLSTDMNLVSGIPNKERPRGLSESSLSCQCDTNNDSTGSYDMAYLRSGSFLSQTQQCRSRTYIYSSPRGAIVEGADRTVSSGTMEMNSRNLTLPIRILPIAHRNSKRLKYNKAILGGQTSYGSPNSEDALLRQQVGELRFEESDAFSAYSSPSERLLRLNYSSEQPCSCDGTLLKINSFNIKDLPDNSWKEESRSRHGVCSSPSLAKSPSFLSFEPIDHGYEPQMQGFTGSMLASTTMGASKGIEAEKTPVVGHENYNCVSQPLPIDPICIRTNASSTSTHHMGFPPISSCLTEKQHYVFSSPNDGPSAYVAKSSLGFEPLMAGLEQRNNHPSDVPALNERETRLSCSHTSTNNTQILYTINDNIKKKGSRPSRSMLASTTYLTGEVAQTTQGLTFEPTLYSISSNTRVTKELDGSGQTALSVESKDSCLLKTVNHFSRNHSGEWLHAVPSKNNAEKPTELDMKNSLLLPNAPCRHEDHPPQVDNTSPSYSTNSASDDNFSNSKVLKNKSANGLCVNGVKSLTRHGEYRWDWRSAIVAKPLQ
ncbi:unnamed protein product [Phytomonas sp. EM1]|nr:unnamed protein product [Phytomonas sp. EM1]|eukprot:CCW62326.1 unnamed protein product [Phytomonas sp. isolate EM1]